MAQAASLGLAPNKRLQAASLELALNQGAQAGSLRHWRSSKEEPEMSNKSLRRSLRTGALIFTLCAMMISLSLVVALAVAAHVEPATSKGSPSARNVVAQSGSLTAALVDPAANAKEKTATVKVQVTGVKLIDPALTNKRPTKGQGHLHYRVDGGPVIATTTTKLSFHELTPGKHQIVVMLANNDHSPTGLEQTLEITVP